MSTIQPRQVPPPPEFARAFVAMRERSTPPPTPPSAFNPGGTFNYDTAQLSTAVSTQPPEQPTEQQTPGALPDSLGEFPFGVTKLRDPSGDAASQQQPGAPEKLGDVASALAGLVSQISENPTAYRIAGTLSGVNQALNSVNARTYLPVREGTPGALVDGQGQAWALKPAPGSIFNTLGGLANAGAALTGNPVVSTVGQGLNGIGDTFRASQAGAGAGLTTGLGAALGVIGGLIKGGAKKVVNALSIAASTAGQILSKATTLGAGLAGGIPSLVGTLIGGPVGQKISSLGSFASGALMAAANPLLGALSMIGGLMGLFKKQKRVSKLSETMAADFKGDGTQTDLLVRAPKGKNNNLEIRLTDDATGQSKKAHTIRIDGWFDDPNQSRQAQTVDLNGDGKQDVVWQNKNELAVFTNNGEGRMVNHDYPRLVQEAKQSAVAIEQYGKVLEAHLDQLPSFKASYDATGGAATQGSFLGYVSRRLQETGIAAPSAVTALAANPQKAAQIDQALIAAASPAQAFQPVSRSAPPVGDGGARPPMSRGMASRSSAQATGDFVTRMGPSRGREVTTVPRVQAAIGDAFRAAATQVQNDVKAAHLGIHSFAAEAHGLGVSRPKQTLDVVVDQQKPDQLFFWDVNGDGATDAVFGGDGVQGVKAFLNDGKGTFINDSIDLNQPSEQDFNQLVLQDPASGQLFINADINGDGKNRLQAVFSPTDGQWYGVNSATPSPDGQEGVQGAGALPAAAAGPQGGGQPAAQTPGVETDQQPGAGQEILSWDVNGDSLPDAVIVDRGTQSVSAFLNKGDGTFDPDRIDLLQPSAQDLNQLALIDRASGQLLVNADLSGLGQPRLQALFSPADGQWYGLDSPTSANSAREQERRRNA